MQLQKTILPDNIINKNINIIIKSIQECYYFKLLSLMRLYIEMLQIPDYLACDSQLSVLSGSIKTLENVWSHSYQIRTMP